MSHLLLIALGAVANQGVVTALERTAPAGSHIVLTKWEAPRECSGKEVDAMPVEGSGRVPVRVRGTNCTAWGWATVRVMISAAVLSRDVRAGESLDGAWETKQIELERGHRTESVIVKGATATRPLRASTPVASDMFRHGPALGTRVQVRVQIGSLSIEQQGTVSPCRADQICATLTTGKKVTGTFDGEVLVVEGSP